MGFSELGEYLAAFTMLLVNGFVLGLTVLVIATIFRRVAYKPSLKNI